MSVVVEYKYPDVTIEDITTIAEECQRIFRVLNGGALG